MVRGSWCRWGARAGRQAPQACTRRAGRQQRSCAALKPASSRDRVAGPRAKPTRGATHLQDGGDLRGQAAHHLAARVHHPEAQPLQRLDALQRRMVGWDEAGLARRCKEQAAAGCGGGRLQRRQAAGRPSTRLAVPSHLQQLLAARHGAAGRRCSSGAANGPRLDQTQACWCCHVSIGTLNSRQCVLEGWSRQGRRAGATQAGWVAWRASGGPGLLVKRWMTTSTPHSTLRKASGAHRARLPRGTESWRRLCKSSLHFSVPGHLRPLSRDLPSAQTTQGHSHRQARDSGARMAPPQRRRGA